MQLSGVYVPLITPFTADGAVDVDAVEKLAAEVLDEGAAGLVALGTTGEPATLTPAEQREVVDICTRVCRTRSATLIVGAGASGTAAAVASLQDLPAQADAALVTAPSYVRPGEPGALAHFAALAAASPVPIVVYNVPYRTGQPLGVDTLRRLAALPGVIGVKHCAGGIDADTIALLNDPPFAVLAGDDLFLSPMLALGAAGGVLASAHVHTAAFVALADAWRVGDVDRARSLGAALAVLSEALFAEPNPAVVKAVLHAQGRIASPAVRLPLLPASAAATEAALAATSAL